MPTPMTVEQLDADIKALDTKIEAIRTALAAPAAEQIAKRTSANDKPLNEGLAELEKLTREQGDKIIRLEERLNGKEAAGNRRGADQAPTGDAVDYLDWARRIRADESLKSMLERSGRRATGWIKVPGTMTRRGRQAWKQRQSGLLTRSPTTTSTNPVPKTWRAGSVDTLPGLNLLVDRIPTVTVGGNTYTYSYQSKTFRVIATINVAVGATDEEIVVKGGYGFRVGATVYADAAETKSAVIESIAYDAVEKTATITLTGQTGFTAAKGAELWSKSYAYTPEAKLAPYGEVQWATTDIVLAKLITVFGVSTEALEDDALLAHKLETQGMIEFDLNLDTQTVKGSGSNNELEGIRNNSDIPTYTRPSTMSKTTALRYARALARLSRIPADTCAVSVNDLRDIDTQETEDGQYILVITNGQLWQMAVTETDSLTDGEAIVGNMEVAIERAVKRDGVDVMFSDSHGDNFAEDTTAVKMRHRTQLAYLRPSALVNVTL